MVVGAVSWEGRCLVQANKTWSNIVWWLNMLMLYWLAKQDQTHLSKQNDINFYNTCSNVMFVDVQAQSNKASKKCTNSSF